MSNYTYIYYYYYYLIIFSFIATPLPASGALHSSSGMYPTPIPIPQPWSLLMAGSWVLLKRHSGSLWRSTKESGSLSRTWWRARRGIWPNWRELELRWSRDGAWKELSKRRRISRLRKLDLVYFIFLFIFYFIFDLFFPFSIFRTTRVRVDWSCCHNSHLMAKLQDRSQDLGEFSRRFENR